MTFELDLQEKYLHLISPLAPDECARRVAESIDRDLAIAQTHQRVIRQTPSACHQAKKHSSPARQRAMNESLKPLICGSHKLSSGQQRFRQK